MQNAAHTRKRRRRCLSTSATSVQDLAVDADQQEPVLSDVEPLMQFFDIHDDSEADPTFEPQQSDFDAEHSDARMSDTEFEDVDGIVSELSAKRKARRVARNGALAKTIIRTRSRSAQAGSNKTSEPKVSCRSSHLSRQLSRRSFANKTRHVELYRDSMQTAGTLLEDSRSLWQTGALRHACQCMMNGDFIGALDLLTSFTVMFLRPAFAECHSLSYIRLTIDALVHVPDRFKDYDYLDAVLKTLAQFSYPSYDAIQLHRALIQISIHCDRIRADEEFSKTTLIRAAAIINEPPPVSHHLNNGNWQHGSNLSQDAFILPTYYKTLRRALLGLLQHTYLKELFLVSTSLGISTPSMPTVHRVHLQNNLLHVSESSSGTLRNSARNQTQAACDNVKQTLAILGVRLSDAEDEQNYLHSQQNVHGSARKLLLQQALLNLAPIFEYCRNKNAPYLTLDVFIMPYVELLLLEDIERFGWRTIISSLHATGAQTQPVVFEKAEKFLHTICTYNEFNCISSKRYLHAYYRWLRSLTHGSRDGDTFQEPQHASTAKEATELHEHRCLRDLAYSLPESAYAFQFMRKVASHSTKCDSVEGELHCITMLLRYTEYDQNRYSIPAHELLVDFILYHSSYGKKRWRDAFLAAWRFELSSERRCRLWRKWFFNMPDLDLLTASKYGKEGDAAVLYLNDLIRVVQEQNKHHVPDDDDAEAADSVEQLRQLLLLFLVTAVAVYGSDDRFCSSYEANIQKCFSVLHDKFCVDEGQSDSESDDDARKRRRKLRRQRRLLRSPIREQVLEFNSVLLREQVRFTVQEALCISSELYFKSK